MVSDNLSIYLSVLTYNRHQQQLCEQNKLVAQLNRSQMKRKNFIYFISEKKKKRCCFQIYKVVLLRDLLSNIFFLMLHLKYIFSLMKHWVELEQQINYHNCYPLLAISANWWHAVISTLYFYNKFIMLTPFVVALHQCGR